MRSFGWLAVALTACGEVNQLPADAALPDAYQHDAAFAPNCAPGEMVCNNTCADVMTSELYCGNCDTSCAPLHTCSAGACIASDTSCARVRELDPTASDGAYRNPHTGSWFYCDYAAGVTIDEIFVNPYTSAPPAPGYQVVRATDFGDPLFVKAFIAQYNKLTGHRAFSTFATSNCCMGPLSGTRYRFGAQALFTGITTAGFYCNQSISANTPVLFGRNGSVFVATLPDNYFATTPVTEGTDCGDGGNAAWWYRRRNTLN